MECSRLGQLTRSLFLIVIFLAIFDFLGYNEDRKG